MLSIMYALGFSMIYLILFRILNYEQKRSVKWLNFALFTLLAIWDVIRQIRYGTQSVGVVYEIIEASLILFVVLYALKGFKLWRAWLSIAIAIFAISLLNSSMVGFITSLRVEATDIRDPINIVIGNASAAAIIFILQYLAKRFGLKINVNALLRVEIVSIIYFLAIFGFFLLIISTVNNTAEMLDEHIPNEIMYYYIPDEIIEERGRLPRLGVPPIVRLVVGFSVIIGVYLVMYFATQRSIIFEIQNREKQQDLIFEEQKQNYERMLKRNEEIDIFKHSINDELLYLYDLLHDHDLEKVNIYLNQMRGKLDVIEQNVGQDTGSKAVNASWYSLTSSKKYKEVKATWFGRLPIQLLIDDRDLVLLFSNLLNNAFEAAHQAVDDKYVVVKIDEKGNKLFVAIRNSYAGEIVEKLDGDFATTKKDKKNHGIGMRIIKNVVEKYGGKAKFSHSGGEFVVTIVFKSDICKVMSA